jgi:DNA-binding response OmpR family regulator
VDKSKILIIDDEKDFLSLMKTTLEQCGYLVVTASDGKEGVAKAKSEKPDMVICDIMMPKKDGYAVLKEIKRDIDKDMPVIMLSAIEEYKSVEKAYDGEADFYVSKPVEFAIFLKNIRALLSIKRNKKG